ncbi:MAG: outer membrane beta-barrel protein [Gammaproteobacteria bacterium]|nr:outer membrane beta-barrel protein [Gammaproteobacteria bacterium]
MHKFFQQVIFITAVGILVTTISSTGLAAVPNFYLEANAGIGKVNESYAQAFTNDTNGFAGSINGGYQFNQYFALELGFNAYPDETFKCIYANAYGKKNYAIDLTTKFILPITASNFSLFAKLGIAGVNHTLDTDCTSWIEDNSGLSLSVFTGAGISYQINQHISLLLQGNLIPSARDLVWSHKIPTMYQGTIGLSYAF